MGPPTYGSSRTWNIYIMGPGLHNLGTARIRFGAARTKHNSANTKVNTIKKAKKKPTATKPGAPEGLVFLAG